MNGVKAVIAEVCRLFVDDGSFALAIVVWLGASWLILPRLHLSGTWAGAILFAGLAGLLADSALRKARKKAR